MGDVEDQLVEIGKEAEDSAGNANEVSPVQFVYINLNRSFACQRISPIAFMNSCGVGAIVVLHLVLVKLGTDEENGIAVHGINILSTQPPACSADGANRRLMFSGGRRCGAVGNCQPRGSEWSVGS